VPFDRSSIVTVLRFLFTFTLFLPAAALAESDCEDTFTECRDDCSLEFGGSIRVELKKKFDKCMKKCTKTANRCTERVMEAKSGGLEEGALDGAPTSDQVDENGIPTKTANTKKKKKVAAEPAVEEDEPRSDTPAKKETLAESELPKSNRTQLKTDEPPPPPPRKEREVAKDEPAPAPKKDVIEMKMTPKKEEEDLRDDKPRASSPPPRDEEPPPLPKKEKKKEDPPRKKEEDHDDLRFY
jgi:hypothetical protein